MVIIVYRNIAFMVTMSAVTSISNHSRLSLLSGRWSLSTQPCSRFITFCLWTVTTINSFQVALYLFVWRAPTRFLLLERLLLYRLVQDWARGWMCASRENRLKTPQQGNLVYRERWISFLFFELGNCMLFERMNQDIFFLSSLFKANRNGYRRGVGDLLADCLSCW